jgi:hypothetical protein
MMSSLGKSDLPYDGRHKDELGLDKYAGALAKFLTSCETPMTVGIQGEWGSGKTSLMNMVRLRLAPDDGGPTNRVKTFTFETWQYGAVGDDSQLGLQLITSIAQRMVGGGNAENGLLAKAGHAIQSITGAVAKAAVAGAMSHATGGLLEGGAFVHSLHSPGTHGAGVVALDDLRKQFEVLVKELLAKTGDAGRVVVFIDDLDRIRPERAVSLLEVLKNFMDVAKCVFVVACDYDVVRLGVGEKFGIKDERKVRAFFDKIIQVPFQLPVENYEMRGLLESFLKERIGKKLNAGEQKSIVGDLEAMVQLAVGTNPRGFKRFLNTIDLLSCLDATGSKGAPIALGDPWADRDSCSALVGLVALQMGWPGVATYLAGRENADALRRAVDTIATIEERDRIGEAGETDDTSATDTALLERLEELFTEKATVDKPSSDECRWYETESGCRLVKFTEKLRLALHFAESREAYERSTEILHTWAARLSLTGVESARGSRQSPAEQFEASLLKQKRSGTTLVLSVIKCIWDSRGDRKPTQDATRTADAFYVRAKLGSKLPQLLSISDNLHLKLNLGEKVQKILPAAKDVSTSLLGALKELGIHAKLVGISGWDIDLSDAKLKPDQVDVARKAIAAALDQIDKAVRDMYPVVPVAAVASIPPQAAPAPPTDGAAA